jgi:DNA-binding NtrC family response regulator
MSETTGDDGRSALIVDNDLFFAVKIGDTLKHAGYRGVTVRRIEDLASALRRAPPAVALVNTGARGLDWHAAVVSLRETGVPTIAYGSHVDLETQERARQAGATLVVANSKLAGDLPALVARALHRHSLDPNSSDSGAGAP